MLSINLVFVDPKTIRQLNKKYRQLDKATTVLSFYYGEGEKGQVQLQPNCQGEIFICPSLAKKQNLLIEDLVTHGLKSLLSQIPAAKNFPTRLRRG